MTTSRAPRRRTLALALALATGGLAAVPAAGAAAPAPCVVSGTNNTGPWKVTVLSRASITCTGAKRIVRRCADSYDPWPAPNTWGIGYRGGRRFFIDSLTDARHMELRRDRGVPSCFANFV